MIFVTGDTHGPEKLGFLSVDGYMPRLNRPASDRVCLGYEEDTRLTSFLEKVKQKIDYKHWFFGHLHDNRTLPGGKDHLLYEQIIRIQ